MDADRKRWLHSQGVCVNCLTVDAYTMAGRWLCAECAEMKRERCKEYRTNNKEKFSAYFSKRRETAKRDGLCRDCGAPAYNGTLYCYAHLWRHRIAQRKYREKSRPYKRDGQCLWCDADAVEGYKYCKDCLERKREILARNRKPPGENHPWNRQTRIIFAEKGCGKNDARAGSGI